MEEYRQRAKDENFPVGSFLLPRGLRPHVATFYALVRSADDIADSAELDAEDKITQLDWLERELRDDGEGSTGLPRRHRESSAVTGVTVSHAIDLLHAFKQDAVKNRYEDWDDLMGYCNLSAAPVGRYLLDLHGEDSAIYRFSDPLCHALQVINHLQDLQDDYRALDRVYLPGNWMAEAGAKVEDLDASSATEPLRMVIDHCLDGCVRLMDESRPLVANLHSRRLAMEAGVTTRLADRLIVLLRAHDPLAARVALAKWDWARGLIGGVCDGWVQRYRSDSRMIRQGTG